MVWCHPAQMGPVDMVLQSQDLTGEQQRPEALGCSHLRPGSQEGGHGGVMQPGVPKGVPGTPSPGVQWLHWWQRGAEMGAAG